ncbi:hypothetical protein GH714_035434 [Hevea brasiliensis]|uniref:RING-type E3 ubiquitin transferase (cysteine targeting) n=1 Tax=Hevea brasiliensis TaxID=3981 RepID=A0A6A6ND66_HEVBR|nr:hypothetical protein GH714_035434 [Hevea brasiliensis]
MGSSSTLCPPEDAWILAHQKLLPQWQSLTLSSHQSTIPISISRVNQFDAARLDIEMSAMLKEQLVKVFSLMKPGMLFQYEPELDAFLEFLIWRFSIWVDKPTPGNALMNLRYRDDRAVEPREKEQVWNNLDLLWLRKFGIALPLLVVNISGLQSFSAFPRWGDSEQRPLARRAWILIQRIEGLYKAASFGNLLFFLYTGRFRNLIERVLRARLIYGGPNMNRAVSFEYMNRQLVWNEFSEMLLLLLPLLNSSSVKNLLAHFQRTNPLVPQETMVLVLFARRFQLFHSWLSPVNTGEEEGRFGLSHFQPKKLENWEDQILNPYSRVPVVADVKQEIPQNSNLYGHGDEEFQPPRPTWSQVMPVSSPKSCVTTLSSNILDFSYNKPDVRNQHPDQSSMCNSTVTGGMCKKPRVQQSSTQPPLKVRKEKLGDRITALHQLVSPFGKTDTASVLLEAIGYIRFLQGQIEALSSPYLGSSSSNMRNQQSDSHEMQKDLRSRGLCLVPVSCTQHVGSDNGADYWAPAIGGGGF